MIFAIILTSAMHALLNTCAPAIGAQTMGGILEYESGWHPWAIGDNTMHKSYMSARSKEEAIGIARSLLAQGHNLDVGYAQVNSANFPVYGLSVERAFDPCTNIRTGASILAGNYANAVKQNWVGHPIMNSSDVYYQEQYALMHSLSAYNSGGFWASMNYASNVYGIARGVHVDIADSRIPLTYLRPVAQTFKPTEIKPQVTILTTVTKKSIKKTVLAAADWSVNKNGRVVPIRWNLNDNVKNKKVTSASKILLDLSQDSGGSIRSN